MRTLMIVGILCGAVAVACGGGEGEKPPVTPAGTSSSGGATPASTGSSAAGSSGAAPTTSGSASGGWGNTPPSSSGGTPSSSSGGTAPAAPEPATFADQTTAGEKLYADHCASCHGAKGEGGGRSPKVVGAGALSTDPPKDAKQRKGKFKNAQDVFDFVSKQMPPGAGGSLKDHEYWSIIAWDLKANGLSSTKKLDSSSAPGIALKK